MNVSARTGGVVKKIQARGVDQGIPSVFFLCSDQVQVLFGLFIVVRHFSLLYDTMSCGKIIGTHDNPCFFAVGFETISFEISVF